MCKQQRVLFNSLINFFIITLLIVSKGQGDCLTPWGELGDCVSIVNCSKMYKILQEKPLPPMNEKILHQAFCGIDGFNYKVCCTTSQNIHPSTNVMIVTTTESPRMHYDNINESCTSLTGGKDNCINIKKCGKMMNLLRQRPMTEETRSYLHRSQCGYEDIYPKVCCEIGEEKTSKEIKSTQLQENKTTDNCISSSGRKGHCVNIKKCQKSINLLLQTPLTEETRNYLRNSQCGSEGKYPKVCCEIEIEEEKPPRRIESTPVDSCLTPWGRFGECIRIKDCENMKKLYIQDPRPPMHEKILENARCGPENIQDPNFRVCCGMKRSKVERTSEAAEVIGASLNQENFPAKHQNSRLLPHNLCGPVPESRIVGGNDTRIHEFPWMALLGYFDISKRTVEYKCGGTLISTKYILTAAHCVTGLRPTVRLIRVRLGEYDMETEEDCDNEGNCIGKYKDFYIDSAKAHEKYSDQTFHNDIGLVKLTTPVDFHSSYIRPICLPLDPRSSSGILKTPDNAVVTGWGATEFSMSNMRLQKVTLPIITNELCQRMYRLNKNVIITQQQMCAGGVRNKDSCTGDSGGPLQAIGMYGNRPSFLQYGIVSFGHTSCGTQGSPAIYTRVAFYIKWILDNMTD